MSARRPRIASAVKKMVLRQTDYRCWYCGEDLTQSGRMSYEIDHIHPVSKGGTNEPSNLVASCRTCNGKKADMTLKEFRAYSGGDLFWYERKEGGWAA